MRKLQYRLADGSVVNTYKEALASGQRYTDFLTPIVKEKPPMSEERKQKLAELYGIKY